MNRPARSTLESAADSLVAMCAAAVDSIVAHRSMSQLERAMSRREPIDERILEAAKEAANYYSEIRTIFKEAAHGRSGIPVVSLADESRNTLHHKLEPMRLTVFRLAYYDPNEPFPELSDLLARARANERELPVHAAIDVALQRMMGDEDEVEALAERGVYPERALEFIYEPLFRPDDWIRNREQLFPVLVELDSFVLPGEVRAVLSEVYKAFTFGLWASCIALCRACVESAIVGNADRLRIALSSVDSQGLTQRRDLKSLINDVETLDAQCGANLGEVRKLGNRLLHGLAPGKAIGQAEIEAEWQALALRAIVAMRKGVQALYSIATPRSDAK